MVAAVVPAHDWPDVRALADVLGAQPVRRASNAEVSAATGYPTTLVSPIGLGPDLPLLVEASLREPGDAVVQAPAGAPGVALGIRLCDLLDVTGARAVDLVVRGAQRVAGTAGAVTRWSGRLQRGDTGLVLDVRG